MRERTCMCDRGGRVVLAALPLALPWPRFQLGHPQLGVVEEGRVGSGVSREPGSVDPGVLFPNYIIPHSFTLVGEGHPTYGGTGDGLHFLVALSVGPPKGKVTHMHFVVCHWGSPPFTKFQKVLIILIIALFGGNVTCEIFARIVKCSPGCTKSLHLLMGLVYVLNLSYTLKILQNVCLELDELNASPRVMCCYLQ